MRENEKMKEDELRTKMKMEENEERVSKNKLWVLNFYYDNIESQNTHV